MSTSSERSAISAVPSTPVQLPKSPVPQIPTEERPEAFEAPDITDLASLTDGRKAGEYASVYPAGAWVQIVIEVSYLVISLVACLGGLAALAVHATISPDKGLVFEFLGPYPKNQQVVVWLTVGLAGACGGCASALKWLYHSVSKKRWHRDRILWRITVPLLSSVLAVFLGLMVVSGIVPFLSKTPLTTPVTGAAFGFFVGFFSDNVLAGLQKLALKIFGTVNKD